jgi:putative transposase
MYRQRFAIETTYRQLQQARIRTSSRSPLLRLLFVGLALLLRNVWVWAHYEYLAERRRGGRVLHGERLRFRVLLDWLRDWAVDLLGVRDHVVAEVPVPIAFAKGLHHDDFWELLTLPLSLRISSRGTDVRTCLLPRNDKPCQVPSSDTTRRGVVLCWRGTRENYCVRRKRSASMGVWGAGNFDGDSPRDFLADMVGHWEQIIEKLLANEISQETAFFEFSPGLDACEACLMPTVEIIITVAERLEPDHLPTPATVERWRSEYLSLFDREVVGWDVAPEFASERRAVIDSTFGRLLNVVCRR